MSDDPWIRLETPWDVMHFRASRLLGVRPCGTRGWRLPGGAYVEAPACALDVLVMEDDRTSWRTVVNGDEVRAALGREGASRGGQWIRLVSREEPDPIDGEVPASRVRTVRASEIVEVADWGVRLRGRNPGYEDGGGWWSVSNMDEVRAALGVTEARLTDKDARGLREAYEDSCDAMAVVRADSDPDEAP